MKGNASIVLSIFSLLVLAHILAGTEGAGASPIIYDVIKFDEYSDLPFSEEKKRLDNLGLQLKSEREDMVGWYFIFAGGKTCPGEARRRAVRAKNYVVKEHGIRADRIIWSDEGYREELVVEIWIRPRELGNPGPTNSPTLDKDDAQAGTNCKPNPLNHGRRMKPRGAPNNSLNRSGNNSPFIVNLDAIRWYFPPG